MLSRDTVTVGVSTGPLLERTLASLRPQAADIRVGPDSLAWAADCEGYYAACKAGVTYPADYIEKMVAAIRAYGRRSTDVFVLACVSAPDVGIEDGLPTARIVQDAGTEALVFHAGALRVQTSDVGAWARNNGVEIMCVARPVGWLRKAN